ncbi:MAG TPA: acyltransferase family protein [Verrucomicrobiae bacterium]|jgi:surface polysaccharide O-acyltransferase-like enzyme
MGPQQTEIRGTGKLQRFEAVDLAKLAAAAAVVWIHVINCDASQELLPLCRFAVPFFTCAAVYFVLQKGSSQKIPVHSYCLQRARRLYVPFLWWSGIYLGARLLKHTLTGDGAPITLSSATLLNGTAHHLWFLPFICLASILAYVAVQYVGPPRPEAEGWFALAFLLVGIGFALTPCPVIIQTVEFPISYFIDHSWDALPAIFFGAALFCLLRSVEPPLLVRAAALLLAFVAIAWEFVLGVHALAPHIAGASILLFTTTQANRDWMKWIWPWAQLAFVVYLVHVLFVEALQTLANRYGGVQSLSADLSIWALALVVSVLTAKFISRSRAVAWFFPR